MLDEGDDAGGVLFSSSVAIPPLGRVAEERGIANIVFLLPVPISGVPLELGYETGLEYPVYQGFFPWGGEPLASLSVAPWRSCSRTLTRSYPLKEMVTSCELVALIRPVLESFLYSLALAVS